MSDALNARESTPSGLAQLVTEELMRWNGWQAVRFWLPDHSNAATTKRDKGDSMHAETQKYLQFLADNGCSLEALPSYAGEIADAFIIKANVEEMLRLLLGSSGPGKEYFFARIARAPKDEQGWKSLSIVGANLTDEDAGRIKIRWRETVDLMRGTGLVV